MYLASGCVASLASRKPARTVVSGSSRSPSLMTDASDGLDIFDGYESPAARSPR